MIQFFYQGVDMMEENVKLNACVMHDRAGGEADGLTASKPSAGSGTFEVVYLEGTAAGNVVRGRFV